MATGLAALELLVIDDNPQVRSILGAVLAAVGVQKVHYASDGRRGLEIVSETSIDIAFVDLEMPVMNGLDFVSAVRALTTPDRYMPLIMLTGHSDLPRILASRDRGVTEFLGKPVTAKSILSRLNTVILNPRPFVAAPNYFGPDRRRKAAPGYDGPRRRLSDGNMVLEL
jgi:CheY-like chemotaxis protein